MFHTFISNFIFSVLNVFYVLLNIMLYIFVVILICVHNVFIMLYIIIYTIAHVTTTTCFFYIF